MVSYNISLKINTQINLLLDINRLLGMGTILYKLSFTSLMLWVKCTFMVVKMILWNFQFDQ